MRRPFSTSTQSSSSLPWISPLQYLRRTKLDPPPEIGTSLQEARSKPRFISHENAMELINNEKNPQRALDIFNSVSKQKGFNHNNATYSAILDKFGECKNFQAVDAILHQMTYEPCKFLEGVFLSLMKHYSKSNLHEKALDMFYKIHPIVREKPSMKAVSTCLNLVLESKQVNLARELLSYSRKSFNFKPNTCIFNILVKYHCKNGDLVSAFEVVDEMRKDNTSYPNLITYSTLIDAMCKNGKLKGAVDLFEEMISKDRIMPDVLTYNVLVNGFCHDGKVDKGRKMVEFMKKNGCNPNIFIYSSLMNGYCREAKFEMAVEVFHEMEGLKLQLDKVGYTTLINCLCKSGKIERAMELVKEIEEKGCKADAVIFNIILGGLCREMRCKEALDLLQRLPHGVCLNKASYRIILNSLCRIGEMQKATELFGLMLSRNVLPHYATSNNLLIQLCKSGNELDAYKILLVLMEMGFKPEPSSWEVLIDVVCLERRLLAAFQLLDNLTA